MIIAQGKFKNDFLIFSPLIFGLATQCYTWRDQPIYLDWLLIVLFVAENEYLHIVQSLIGKNFYCILDLAQFKFNYFLLRHYEIFSLLEDPAPKLKISGNIVVGLFDNANVFFSYHTLARYLLYRPATISCVCTHYIRSSTVQIYVSVVVQQTHLSCTK